MKKNTSVLWILSLALNGLFMGFGAYKIFKTHQQHLKEKKLSFQPEKVQYFVGRNEVLGKLPVDTNEIIMLGDSHTQNFEWHEIFKDVPIINRGINGDITRGVLNRLNAVIERKPNKIFLEIGVHADSATLGDLPKNRNDCSEGKS